MLECEIVFFMSIILIFVAFVKVMYELEKHERDYHGVKNND